MMKSAFSIVTFCTTLGLFCLCQAIASEELVIVGTGSGMPLLQAVGQAFNKQHPEISVSVPDSIGSGGGIKAVGEDRYKLGRIARNIQEKEKKYGLIQVPLAKTPIVFYVNAGVTIKEITSEQACRIYDGTLRRWEEIGGMGGKIRVIIREIGDSSLLVLNEKLPGFRDIELTPRSKTTYSDQETVLECIKQDGAIAFGCWVDIKDVKDLHVIAVDGMHPDDPSYPYTGILDLAYKQKHYNGALKKFVEFISSDVARKAIVKSGGIPAK
jgi:phosphate transport system substrate-binding protein